MVNGIITKKGFHRDGVPRYIVEFRKDDIVRYKWVQEGRKVKITKR